MRRRWIVATGLVPAALWLASLALVVAESRRDHATPADAMIVLGAAQYNGRPSPVFAARLRHAALLWQRGLAPVIVLTGGMGANDTLSEAEAGRRFLSAMGVPDSVLLVEATGRSSEPSLRAAARRIKARGGHTAILVSDGFHMLRLGVIARRLGLAAAGSPATLSPIGQSPRREIPYFLAESFKVPIAFLVTRSE